MPRAHQFDTGVLPPPLKPNKRHSGSARQTAWLQDVELSLLCNKPDPTGGICVLRHASFTRRVGNDTHAKHAHTHTHTHLSCKSDSFMCLPQGYGAVSQPAWSCITTFYVCGWCTTQHRHVDHVCSDTTQLLHRRAPEGDLSCPSGVFGLLTERVMPTRTPAQPIFRPDSLGETELVRLNQDQQRHSSYSDKVMRGLV